MPSKQTTTRPKKLSDWSELLDKREKNLRQITLVQLMIVFTIGLSLLMLLSGCTTKPAAIVNSPKLTLPAYYQNDFEMLPEMTLPESSNTPLGNTTPAPSSTTSSGRPAQD